MICQKITLDSHCHSEWCISHLGGIPLHESVNNTNLLPSETEGRGGVWEPHKNWCVVVIGSYTSEVTSSSSRTSRKVYSSPIAINHHRLVPSINSGGRQRDPQHTPLTNFLISLIQLIGAWVVLTGSTEPDLANRDDGGALSDWLRLCGRWIKRCLKIDK